MYGYGQIYIVPLYGLRSVVLLSTPGPTLLRQGWKGDKRIVPDLTRWWSAGEVPSPFKAQCLEMLARL